MNISEKGKHFVRNKIVINAIKHFNYSEVNMESV